MKKVHIITGVGALAWMFPMLVLAQSNFNSLNSLFGNIVSFINGTLVPFVFAIAFLVFIWGVAKYFILSGASEEGKEQGRQLMIWGIIGFFVMVAVWGIVNLLVSSSGLGGESLKNIPDVPRR